MGDVGELDEPGTRGLRNKRAGFLDPANMIMDAVQRDPRAMQLGRWQETCTRLELLVAQTFRLAQWFTQIQLHAERQSQRASENSCRCLAEPA